MTLTTSTPELAPTVFSQGARARPEDGVSPALELDQSVVGEVQLQWYCLRARLKREHFAARQLAERTGLEVFSPRLALRRPQRSGAVATVVETLFPGYVFARFRLPVDSRLVSSTPDITGIVHFGSHTPPVPDDLIALLRQHATTEHFCTPVLAAGDWVEVLAGSLLGAEGRIVAFESGRQRACVLLSLLGQDLQVNLPAGALRRHGPACLDFPPQLLAACG